MFDLRFRDCQFEKVARAFVVQTNHAGTRAARPLERRTICFYSRRRDAGVKCLAG